MGKWKSGDLHSGSKTGPKVTNQSQAIAIMLAEKRKEQGGHDYKRIEAVNKARNHNHNLQ
jgi:hypothetical protein